MSDYGKCCVALRSCGRATHEDEAGRRFCTRCSLEMMRVMFELSDDYIAKSTRRREMRAVLDALWLAWERSPEMPLDGMLHAIAFEPTTEVPEDGPIPDATLLAALEKWRK